MDPRYQSYSNFIIARGDPITINTGAGMGNLKRCTYIIKKTFSKVGLLVEILQNMNVEITYFTGGKRFSDLR